MSALKSFERKDILLNIAALIKERENEFVTALAFEVGKTLKDARVEVLRAIDT